jgi:hypothetical protein
MIANFAIAFPTEKFASPSDAKTRADNLKLSIEVSPSFLFTPTLTASLGSPVVTVHTSEVFYSDPSPSSFESTAEPTTAEPTVQPTSHDEIGLTAAPTTAWVTSSPTFHPPLSSFKPLPA